MNFGFVSTRFSGTDGVSLESAKWAEVFERAGHRCYWFSGLSDRPEEFSFIVPEAHFAHPSIEAIGTAVWGHDTLSPEVEVSVRYYRSLLKTELAAFIDRFAIDLLVPQNAITIPMHLPLGLALTDLIRETRIATLAHHHDFHWERDRFSGKAAEPWLDEAFPPNLPGIVHAVIHSGAAKELRNRSGIAAIRVPNVMNFSAAPSRSLRDQATLRETLDLAPEDRLILQPTRVVPRKGIEHAIELVRRLGDSRNRLLVSHEAGDEGLDYRNHLLALAGEKGVDLRFLDPHAAEEKPSLDELYILADFVTFPSLFEGFGNALLEAIFFRKPVLVNRYPVFVTDIEPLGFDFVVIDGAVTDEAVSRVHRILEDSASFDRSAEKNFRLAAKHFGFPTLESRLGELLQHLGLDPLQSATGPSLPSTNSPK